MTSSHGQAAEAQQHDQHPSRVRRAGVFFAIAALIVAVDQGTKSLVRARLDLGETWPAGWELIRIAHIENSGAAFGILSGQTQFLTVAALLAVLVVTALIVGLARAHRWYALSMSLVLGGAIGNLVDRARLGAVTDFIDPIAYPAFNVADSAIVVGVGALLVFAFFDGEDETSGESTDDERPEQGTTEMASAARGPASGDGDGHREVRS